ncbi:Transcriptional regulator [Agyrium rufum]|nr:Transcriptional regulator [Agyrium rufum]
MPPLQSKPKNKGKDSRQSRSRNTTPGSVVSASHSILSPSHTAYLDIALSSLLSHSSISYDDILEKARKEGGIPDATSLQSIVNDLETLAAAATKRGEVCDLGMRELADRRKERLDEDRVEEQQRHDEEEREAMRSKRAAEEDAEAKERIQPRIKKRKERSAVREERPLTHGAHGLARQDGMSPLPSSELDLENERLKHLENRIKADPWDESDPSSPKPSKTHATAGPTSSSTAAPGKHKTKTTSPNSSPLSSGSQGQSPAAIQPEEEAGEAVPTKVSPTSPKSENTESRQPSPAPRHVQVHHFGSNPLTYDDPTIYNIRDVTDDMTDDERRDIYQVKVFPRDDLQHMIAGIPPTKDFSNAKPTNQVNFNTFHTMTESYLRPLTEEDKAWLEERGDRVTPFTMPPRGKRHYTEIWAEEDGQTSVDLARDEKFAPNQPRGTVDQLDDEVAETDQVSVGPMLSRLLALMRASNPPISSPAENHVNGLPNGTSNGEAPSALNGSANDIGNTNGDITMTDAPNSTTNGNGLNLAEPTLPPATMLADSMMPGWKVPPPITDFAEADQKVLAELQHLGMIEKDAPAPDYDAGYDDPVAERMRILQAELRRVTVENAAKKARLLEFAKLEMARQEYITILDDLDNQVNQAFLKRSRTLGRGKKGGKKPTTGGASGLGAAAAGGAGGAGGSGGAGSGLGVVGMGVTKPALPEETQKLLARRKKWIDELEPIFEGENMRVRHEGDNLFEGPEYEALLKEERERLEEEIDYDGR